MKRKIRTPKPKTCSPRVPVLVNDMVQNYAIENDISGVKAYEVVVTLGIQRSEEFAKSLERK